MDTLDISVMLSDFLRFECSDFQSSIHAAIVSGVLSLSVHLLCHSLFQQGLGGKIIKKDPGFMAHQVVTIILMVTMVLLGGAKWVTMETPSTAEARLFTPDPTARYLASMSFGMLLAWDIPCSLGLVKSMTDDKLMLGHHIVMCFVAYVGMTSFPSYYFLFFLGLTEISSIPLVIMNIFHPNRFKELLDHSKFLSIVNEIVRVLFAIMFLITRALYFPYVFVGSTLPDLYDLGIKKQSDRFTLLAAVAVSGIALTLLQLYWASLIVKQLLKMLSPKKKKTT
eukprot:g1224.t1